MEAMDRPAAKTVDYDIVSGSRDRFVIQQSRAQIEVTSVVDRTPCHFSEESASGRFHRGEGSPYLAFSCFANNARYTRTL